MRCVIDGGGRTGREGGDCLGGEEGDWLEEKEKEGGCWWEGEEGDLVEVKGGRGMF